MTLIKRGKYYVSEIIYYFLILFLSYVFVNKFLDINAFTSNIAKTGIFPEFINELLSYSVLLIEVIAIIILLFNKKTGLYYCLIMFLLFTFYITILNYTDRYEVCGCGGILNGLSFNIHLLINIILIFITTISIHYHYENKTPDRN